MPHLAQHGRAISAPKCHAAPVTLTIGEQSLDQLAQGALKPPLVSFVVICWNYAQYVGDAIASIRAQDYPHFECLVINNGSTDESGSVIAHAIEGDSRFTISTLPENLGQLGAAIWALDQIKGSFVTFVDADDILCPSFASTHLQVHLALPRNVALTSSNVIEVNTDGRLITGQYDNFGRNEEDSPGLNAEQVVPRLSSVSAAQYQLLSEQTKWRPPNRGGWCWAPGTANMFRKTVLNFCRLEGENAQRMRAADAHFNRLCHGIAGTGFIDLPLSGYRQHDSNYFATSETLSGIRRGSREYASKDADNRRETVESVVGKASHFNWLLAGRFWSFIDQLQNMGISPLPGYRDDPRIIEMFTRKISHICDEFGYRRSVKEIAKRFGPLTARRMFHDGLPPARYRRVRKYIATASIRNALSALKRKRG
jgi:glycosyltransferase involved in cell wall biosynthesis